MKGTCLIKVEAKKKAREDMYAWCRCPKASADYLQMQQNEIRLCLEHYSAKQLLAQLNRSKVFAQEVPGQGFWQMLPVPES